MFSSHKHHFNPGPEMPPGLPNALDEDAAPRVSHDDDQAAAIAKDFGARRQFQDPIDAWELD